jgi:hypothetical protein
MPERIEAIDRFVEPTRRLKRAERLILLEMMAARLGDALLPQERAIFLDCVEGMARADEQITTYEIACLQVVRRRLCGNNSGEGRKPSHRAIVRAARTLATRLAQETEPDRLPHAHVMKQASQQAPFFMNQLKPIDSTSYEAIDQAFDTLDRSPLGLRRQFLQICERIVAADQSARMEEVELLRAIAIGLGVPSAPIFPESEIELPDAPAPSAG